MKIQDIFKNHRQPHVFITQPLLSEKVLLTNYYDELQKNNWSNIIEDDTKDLPEIILQIWGGMKMFGKMLKDKVILVKEDGQRYENIPANVQPNIIFIEDTTILIEEGDKLVRILPNNLEETYIVIDRGFYSTMGSFKNHYQVKVRKESGYGNNNKNGNTSINNFYGSVTNSQIQQHSQNSSQSISVNGGFEKKDELIAYIKILKENLDKIGLQEDKLSVINENIETIEKELMKENSKPRVIKEGLSTIRNVFEGAVGSIIASGLIYQMGIFMN